MTSTESTIRQQREAARVKAQRDAERISDLASAYVWLSHEVAAIEAPEGSARWHVRREMVAKLNAAADASTAVANGYIEKAHMMTEALSQAARPARQEVTT